MTLSDNTTEDSAAVSLPSYADTVVAVPSDEMPKDEEERNWLLTLPAVRPKKREFLIAFPFNENRLVFCVRELTWVEAADIETRAYRTNSHGELYFSGEYERRETLATALRWSAVIDERTWQDNKDGRILTRIHQMAIDALWERYSAMTELTDAEARPLYQAAANYFRPDGHTALPVPTIVREVDLLLKFGGLSRKEMRKLSRSDMERFQLILMARAETLGLAGTPLSPPPITAAVPMPREIVPPSFYPPGHPLHRG